MATERGRVAHQQQLAASAGHAHIHAANVSEEADFAVVVAARQRNGNDVPLLALKRIDRAHAQYAALQVSAECFALLDGVFQVVDLGTVGC